MGTTRTLKVLRKQQLDLAANHPGLFALVWLIHLGKTELPIMYLKQFIFYGYEFDKEMFAEIQLGQSLGYYTMSRIQNSITSESIDNKQDNRKVTFTPKGDFLHSVREKIPNKIQDKYKPLFENAEFLDAWENWSIVRKAKKSAMTPRSDNQALKRLTELSGNNLSVMIKMIDEAASGGWTKFYKLSYAVESKNEDVKKGSTFRPTPKVT